VGKKEFKKTSRKKKKALRTKPVSENARDRSGTLDIRAHLPTILVCLVLIAATYAVYWNVTGHTFINLDDNLYVYENRHVQNGITLDSITWAFTTTHASNWHPLTWLSHMLDSELYGLNPRGHHLTNLLVHIVNTLLVFFVLRRLTGTLWRSGFVAALFALHPLHVESVAWVAERKDVLSTLFWMLTIWAYTWYVERPKLTRYLLTLLTFALGLMAKPMLVTLPFVLMLLDYWPLGRLADGQWTATDNGHGRQSASTHKMERQAFRLLWEKAPFLALTAASSLVTFVAQKSGGAVTTLEVYPIKIRIANALVSYVKYMGKMFWPQKLAVLYPHPGYTLPMWQILGAGFLLVTISILALKARRRYPYCAVGWLWYLGTLVPVIGLVQVGSQAMADRYTYVPLIGLFIIIAWGGCDLVAKWPYRRVGLGSAAGALISALMICSFLQVQLWKNSITLFEHTLVVTSNNWFIHYNLGVTLDKKGRIDEAIKHYLVAVRIKPDNEEAHYNLGNALDKKGRIDEAIKHYLVALGIKPDNEKTHYNLGNALDKKGRLDEAIKHYLVAVRIKPDHEKAHNNLGIALDKKGRLDEAIKHYLVAVRIKPDYGEAHNNLGIAFYHKGNVDMAIKHFQKALLINPNDSTARNNLRSVTMLKKRNQ